MLCLFYCNNIEEAVHMELKKQYDVAIIGGGIGGIMISIDRKETKFECSNIRKRSRY